MHSNADLNNRPDYDCVIQDLTGYVLTFQIFGYFSHWLIFKHILIVRLLLY